MPPGAAVKGILQFFSRRNDFDGWAVAIKGKPDPLSETFSTIRKEARDMRDEMELDLFQRTEVVKVRVKLERVR